MPGPKTVRVEAPADMDPLDIAQAVVGPHVLLKAEANKPTGSARTFQDYKAMATLSKRFEAAYRKQLDKIVQKIREYVEKRIILGPLGKADGPKKPVVTPAQLRDLRQIIEDYHQAFIAGTIGPDTLKPADVQRLIDAGILPADIGYTFQPGVRELPPAAMNAIEDAYRYGHVLAASRTLDEKRLRGKITYDQFVTEYAPRTPLTPAELNAIEWLKHSAATEIVGLGNRVADNFATTAIEADAELRRKYMGLIREALEENVERRDTWRKLASDLGHKTGDWARDFGRIAATEKSKAMQEGVASGLIKEYGDPEDVRVAKLPNPGACPDCVRLHYTAYGDPEDVRVAKLPNPGACPDCVRLHYTAGEGSTLRIFKLSELVGNGTNVGKKRAAWEATVGPVHPWCGCELIHVPEGMGFDVRLRADPRTRGHGLRRRQQPATAAHAPQRLPRRRPAQGNAEGLREGQAPDLWQDRARQGLRYPNRRPAHASCGREDHRNDSARDLRQAHRHHAHHHGHPAATEPLRRAGLRVLDGERDSHHADAARGQDPARAPA
jgi:hypothetical protein